ncbi:MAG TPA: hypothetical protein VFZ25_13450 [Chloroflexota bacterium]|nr:hypothetical protein [Chloroflexota bacterium]
MRSFWRLMHVLFFWRAVFRGPSYFLRYEARRQGRKALYRMTRVPRRRRRRGIL